MPLSPGTRLGAYEIVTPLGAGGMGEVYRVIYDRPATMGTNAAGGRPCEGCGAAFSLKKVR